MSILEQHLTNRAFYLAPQGLEHELRAEIERKGLELTTVRERLFGVAGTPDAPVAHVAPALAWAQNIWQAPIFIPINSINDGAAKLKNIQRNWALYPTGHHRRASLIAEKLPPVKAAPLQFGAAAPQASLGSWTLWEPDLILASPACSSPFAHGEARFIEDKSGPPNRAYLKLWEAFTLIAHTGKKLPGTGALCIDLGSSPGGWTWVAAKMGAHVFSIDKAPLDENLLRDETIKRLVHPCLGSAFALEPEHVGTIDWLLCDVACYPERLLELLARWLNAGAFKNAVCTVKYQNSLGSAGAEALAALENIPGSRLLHLFHNKHELTWIKLEEH